MKTLAKKVGDFTSNKDKDLTVEGIKKRKDELLKKTDLKEFLDDVERGYTFFDELMVAYYDYLDGGIGSTYIFISVSEDLDEGGFDTSYAVASEYNGDITVEEYIPIGDEERLLDVFNDTLIANTKEFAKRMKE